MVFNAEDLSVDGVRALQPYQPGKSVKELERELGLSNIVKLASNENPRTSSVVVTYRLPEAQSSRKCGENVTIFGLILITFSKKVFLFSQSEIMKHRNMAENEKGRLNRDFVHR